MVTRALIHDLTGNALDSPENDVAVCSQLMLTALGRVGRPDPNHVS